tara:strand:- start:89 stop:691 length:603 start_codon:yes stop_codon:yes gene_type:complete
MTKPFNIHDWQAKRRLTENDDKPHNWKELPGYNKDFYDKDSIFAKLKNDPNFIKKVNTKNAKKDVAESLNPEVSRSLDKFIRAMADRYDYTMQDAVYAIMAALKQRNYEFIDEHHEGGPLADKLKVMSANELMDFIKSQSELRYDELEGMLEDWWDLDEMSISGRGTTINPDSSHFGTNRSSDAYATPRAFKKNQKDKKI